MQIDRSEFGSITIDEGRCIQGSQNAPSYQCGLHLGDFDRLATSDLTLRGFTGSPASILMIYDIIYGEIQICVVPYSDLEMVCIPEKTPPSK
jgi:hypothetical protein